MKWILEHGMYGCETGCCGYYCRSPEDHAAGLIAWKSWTFEHPPKGATSDEQLRAFARLHFKDVAPGDEIEIGEWRSCGF